MTQTMPKADLQRRIQEQLQAILPAEWVRDMIEHYHRTGEYRCQDLRRLLGDPRKGVEVSPNPTCVPSSLRNSVFSNGTQLTGSDWRAG